MISAEPLKPNVTCNFYQIPTLTVNICPFCMTKAAHPRLGRGESYVCGYKPYHCDVCNYSTTTKGNLAIHQQSDKHLNNIQELEQSVLQPSPKSSDASTGLNTMGRKGISVQPRTSPKAGSKCKASTIFRPAVDEMLGHPPYNGQFGNVPASLNTSNEIDQHRMHPSSILSTDFIQLSKEDPICVDSVNQNVLTTEHFVAKLIESSPYPLACRVCCAFTTDKLELLLKHAERNRVPSEHDPINGSISNHIGGFWICRLCSYKTPLKANFQLHCKTEKHSQRLNLLLHICEGGPANQLRVLAPLDSSGEEDSDNSVFSGEKSYSGLLFNPVQCAVRTRQHASLVSNVQLVCLACNVFTTSTQKFRAHTQCPRHAGAIDAFNRLVNARKLLWTRLAEVTLTCVELTNSLPQFKTERDSGSTSDRSSYRFLTHLGQMLARLGIHYVCLRGCKSDSTNGDDLKPGMHSVGQMSLDTMSKALAHWHSTEHQQALTHFQQFQDNGTSLKQSTSECGETNGLDVFWTLGDVSGTLDQLPSLISSLLAFPKDSSIEKDTVVSDGLSVLNGTEISSPQPSNTNGRQQQGALGICTRGTDVQLSDATLSNETASSGLHRTVETDSSGSALDTPTRVVPHEDKATLSTNESNAPSGSVSISSCSLSLSAKTDVVLQEDDHTLAADTQSSRLKYESQTSQLSTECFHSPSGLALRAKHVTRRTPTLQMDSTDDTASREAGINGKLQRLEATQTEVTGRPGHSVLSRPRSAPLLETRSESLSYGLQLQALDQFSLKRKRPKSLDSRQISRDKKDSVINSALVFLTQHTDHATESRAADSSEYPEPPNLCDTTITMTEYANGQPNSQMLDSVLPSVWHRHGDTHMSTAEATTLCYFCHNPIAYSDLLVHMAMHFVQLSKHAPTKKMNDEDQPYRGSTEQQFNMFCQEFGHQTQMGHHLLAQISSVLKHPKWGRLSVEHSCDTMSFLSLLIELIAHSEIEESDLYQQVNSNWFRLDHVRRRQALSSNSCMHCQARFLFPSTLELHLRLSHPACTNDAVSTSQLLQLFREVCSELSTQVEITPTTSTPTLSDMNANVGFLLSASPDATYLYPFSTSPFRDLLRSGYNGIQPIVDNTSTKNYVKGTSFPSTDNPTNSMGLFVPPCSYTACGIYQTQPQRTDIATSLLQHSASGLEEMRTLVTTPLQQRRGRTRLTEVQLSILRSYFDITNSPSEEKIMEIAAKTSLQPKVIKHWFRNTLFKERQKNKDNPYNFSIPPSTSLNLEEYEKTGRVEVQHAPLERGSANQITAIGNGLGSGCVGSGFLGDAHALVSVHHHNITMQTCSSASVETGSLRVSDTDSSSNSGFSVTPPVKRLRLSLTPECANEQSCSDRRLLKVPACSSPTRRMSEPACGLFPMEAVERGPCDFGIDVKCGTPPIQPAHLHSSPIIKATVNGGTAVHHAVNSSSTISPVLSYPQRLSAYMMNTLDSNLNSTVSSYVDPDSPLDLSMTGLQNPQVQCPSASFGALVSAQLQPTCVMANLLEACSSTSNNKHHMGYAPHSLASQSTSTQSMHGTRRNRTSITVLQSRCMQSIYTHHKTPSVPECDRLGSMIGLTRRVVQVWFQNQRAKEKKMARISSNYINGSLSQVNTHSLGEVAQFDPTFCHLCCVPIRTAMVEHETALTMPSGSTALTTHASFVDHLFSHGHLINLINWCSVETTAAQF